VDEGIGNLASCLLQDAAEGRPGDFHFLCRLFLIHPEQVGKAQCLQFVQFQHNHITGCTFCRLK
jgi:hypothetical protein